MSVALSPEDFKRLPRDGVRFEALVTKLLEAIGYRILEKPAVGPDGGRDVLVERRLKDVMGEKRERVVVQCKHFAHSSRAVGDDDVGIWVNTMARYRASGYLLITDSRITENLGKSFREFTINEATSSRWAHFWDVDDLIVELNKFPELCDVFMPGHSSSLNPQEVDSVAAVQARLRLFANARIEQFARGKYIPKLYVTRSLQNDIVRFSASECTIAESSRASLVVLTEELVDGCKNYLLAFDSKTKSLEDAIHDDDKTINSINSKLRGATKRIVRLKDQTREKERMVLEQSRLLNLKSDKKALTERKKLLTRDVKHREDRKRLGKALIEDLLMHLDLCALAAQRLPAQTYFLEQSQYYAFSEALASTLSVLDTKVGDGVSPRSGYVTHNLRHFNVEQDIGLLSEEGFLNAFKDRLKGGIDDVNRLFRNTIVIIDRAGSGKTNMVCHLVDSLAKDGAIILLFGKEQFQGHDSIINAITDVLLRALGRSNDVMEDLDRMLEKEGRFLTVFIDGINENRRIVEFDAAIGSCLEWARGHRIKFVFTCRDIYWEFFNYDAWGDNVNKVLREGLNQFSRREYISALPLYLEYYRINCDLADEAREACHHPLLLRFFCEAYGSVRGLPVSLGEVRDIRLKELFDIYLNRKAEQTRQALSHRNSDRVLKYLFSLVSFMFKNMTTTLRTSDIEDATGDSNTSTLESLYLRLLDEDIIIEERPSDDIDNRNISFVYEEFMEYLLARSIVNTPRHFGVANTTQVFQTLDRALPDWVNARGVGEYVALMLIQMDGKRNEAISFFNLMIDQGKSWGDAFWSVIGKCPESKLDTDVFDLFSSAINLAKLQTVKRALTAMSRYSQEGSNKLATVLLWSLALPKALTWTELSHLEELSPVELELLGDRLVERLATKEFSPPPGNLAFDSLLDVILPFLERDQQMGIEMELQKHGGPTDRHSSRAFIRVFWKFFPAYQPMLLNGLFDNLDWTRSFCADRLKFTKSARQQVAYLCGRLACVEESGKVKSLLVDCSVRLRDSPKTPAKHLLNNRSY